MKRTIYLLAITLLALTLTMSTAAYAKKKKPEPATPSLPINTNVVYLVIAGLAIGIFTVRKSKQSEAGVR